MEMMSDFSTIMEKCAILYYGKGWCSLALQRDYHWVSR